MSRSQSSRTLPEERTEVIEKFRSSGLTQKAFCEREGIALSTFQNWLKVCARSDSFTEVVSERVPSTTVELIFPDGTALRIRGE